MSALTFEQRRLMIPELCSSSHCECDDEARLQCDTRLFVKERNMTDPHAFKADDGKPNWYLLMSRKGCARALAGVVRVLSFAVREVAKGGKGYTPHSWRKVPDAKERYESALYRHLSDINSGETHDRESGESHWYHVATNALFLAELHNEESQSITRPRVTLPTAPNSHGDII